MNQKKEMPENIRKMFEQKNAGSNASFVVQKPQSAPIPAPINNKNDEVSPQTPPQENISQNQENTSQNQKELPQKPEKLPQKPEKIEKKEKIEKISQEKTNKKKLSKKTKTIIISLSCLVLIGAIVLTIFLCLPKTKRLDTPTLQVFSLSNQIILYVDENRNADAYEFYYQKQGAKQNSFIYNENQVSLSMLFNDENNQNTLGTYTFWARYVSSNEKLSSKTSEKVTKTFKKQLAKINVGTGIVGNVLTFAKNDKASGYKIYYNGEDYVYITQPVTDNVSVNLKDLFVQNSITPKSYALSIQAIAGENGLYDNSELSDLIEYVHTVELEPVLSATFNKSTYSLDFTINTAKTNTTKFEIELVPYLSESKVIVIEFDEIKENLSYNLSLVFSKFGYLSADVVEMNIKAYGSEYVITSSSLSVTLV